MLTQILIRDLATISELQLNLKNGCTMITGETGAGKSVFIEAIELALGGRASGNVVRPGKEKADISLCFDITEFPKVISALKNLDLYQASDECIIRRVISTDGRSRCYVNSLPATVHLVKELGELLFHLHSQHEQQVLLQAENQREMLDRFADQLQLASDLKDLALQWKTVDQQIKELQTKSMERVERSTFLRFQLDELEGLHLKSGEWETLEIEHKRLSHAEELIKNIQYVIDQLANADAQGIITSLHNIRKTLESIQNLEKAALNWGNTIHSVLIQLGDIESELQSYLSDTELDPETLRATEERVSRIFELARKHKIAPQLLPEFQEKLRSELNNLTLCDENITKLSEEKQAIEKQYSTLSKTLTDARRKASQKLEKEINQTIRSLSLPHGEFKIELEAITEEGLSLHGQEKIIFLIKTNPDQALQPLAKVISGGELSRLSLAAHLALAHRTTIPTLVFDEVDTGLSGATAEKIGKLLRKLGGSYQVFCVTHQAQVAALGHHHLLVEKKFKESSTYTQLRLLSDEEKTKEIARMLGGEKITQKTLDHAREILQLA